MREFLQNIHRLYKESEVCGVEDLQNIHRLYKDRNAMQSELPNINFSVTLQMSVSMS
jgi:hypothetical protein